MKNNRKYRRLSLQKSYYAIEAWKNEMRLKYPDFIKKHGENTLTWYHLLWMDDVRDVITDVRSYNGLIIDEDASTKIKRKRNNKGIYGRGATKNTYPDIDPWGAAVWYTLVERYGNKPPIIPPVISESAFKYNKWVPLENTGEQNEKK